MTSMDGSEAIPELTEISLVSFYPTEIHAHENSAVCILAK